MATFHGDAAVVAVLLVSLLIGITWYILIWIVMQEFKDWLIERKFKKDRDSG